ncbi:MAG: DUF2760 domain-containing protein [Gammaproteobacteria bacterium]|jgi:hypothetical protein|nr:DUF2760 domain-containing protein [Gammaproteobacteria bacterium]
MNFDLTSMPVTIDLLHAILGIIALVFLALFLIRSRNISPAAMDNLAVQPESAAASAPVAETITSSQLKTTSPDAALQLLALLQQEARFIDFIQEDLLGFSDADVGAAARVVHEGGKKVINDYFSLTAVRDEQEESRITLPEGFDATAVRLTGNVIGQAPFTGTLIHRGWKVTEVRLPKLAEGHDAHVIAPAEVEL